MRDFIKAVRNVGGIALVVVAATLSSNSSAFVYTKSAGGVDGAGNSICSIAQNGWRVTSISMTLV